MMVQNDEHFYTQQFNASCNYAIFIGEVSFFCPLKKSLLPFQLQFISFWYIRVCYVQMNRQHSNPMINDTGHHRHKENFSTIWLSGFLSVSRFIFETRIICTYTKVNYYALEISFYSGPLPKILYTFIIRLSCLPAFQTHKKKTHKTDGFSQFSSYLVDPDDSTK